MENRRQDKSNEWRQNAVKYARIMSRIKWIPVAESMPIIKGRGYYEKGKEYTGVPYSSVKSIGRDIGFDIFLKTFLAAVQNPRSILYSENLSGKLKSAGAYYGKVCSSYTSYALQCGFYYVARHHTPCREGVKLVEPQSAQAAEVGDIIFTPPTPTSASSHVEIITEIIRNENGAVTDVLVEDCWPPTTRTLNYPAANFDSHISSKMRKLYRMVDFDVWRGANRAESFLFPNYKEDAAAPMINRVLLLDLGDWVPYHKDQPVKINVMDTDSRGVKSLVIKRGGAVVEEIALNGPGVVERSFSVCGDYTAHCVMNDGSMSQACEFSVCDLDFVAFPEEVIINEKLEVEFHAANMNVITIFLSRGEENYYARYNVFLTEQDRQNRRTMIPASLIQEPGKWQVWLVGENRYGRLRKCREILVKGALNAEQQ